MSLGVADCQAMISFNELSSRYWRRGWLVISSRMNGRYVGRLPSAMEPNAYDADVLTSSDGEANEFTTMCFRFGIELRSLGKQQEAICMLLSGDTFFLIRHLTFLQKFYRSKFYKNKKEVEKYTGMTKIKDCMHLILKWSGGRYHANKKSKRATGYKNGL